MTHTPGPWEYDDTREYYAPRMVRNNGRLVAEVREARGTQFDGMKPLPAETAANGQLIASEPDLLAALESIIHEWGNLSLDEYNGAIWAIQRAHGLSTERLAPTRRTTPPASDTRTRRGCPRLASPACRLTVGSGRPASHLGMRPPT